MMYDVLVSLILFQSYTKVLQLTITFIYLQQLEFLCYTTHLGLKIVSVFLLEVVDVSRLV